MKKIIITALFIAGISYAPLRADVSEVKFQQTEMKFTPDSQVSLPNGIIDIMFQQNVSSTQVVFKSRYDYVNNYINAGFDFRYNWPVLFAGFGLADDIYFEALYSNQRYLQRTRYIRPYIGEKVSTHAELVTAFTFEDTYTAGIDNLLTLDRGKNTIVTESYAYDNLEPSLAQPRGERVTLSLSKAFSELGGNYDYTMAETTLSMFLYPHRKHFLKLDFKAGYPISLNRQPLADIYYIGGFDIMRGYAFREFAGNSLIYMQLGYHIPLVKLTDKEIRDATLGVLTADVYAEVAKIGEKDIFEVPGVVKSSGGVGLGCVMKLFGRIRTRFTVSVYQAADPLAPVFYFTLSTLTYDVHKQ